MPGRRHWLARAETQVVILVMGVGLLGWPLVATTERMPFVYGGLAYLFGVWFVLVLVLALVARALRAAIQTPKHAPKAEPGSQSEG